MGNRYRIALAQGRDVYEQTIREDADLLHEFGLQLLSASSGVRAAVEKEVKGRQINPWNVMEINEKTWNWLRPLLLELQDARLGTTSAAAK